MPAISLISVTQVNAPLVAIIFGIIGLIFAIIDIQWFGLTHL